MTTTTILNGYLAAAHNAETHHEGALDGLRFTIAQHPGGHDYNIEPVNAELKALAVFRDDDLYHDDEGRGVNTVPVDGDIAAAFRKATTEARKRMFADFLTIQGVPQEKEHHMDIYPSLSEVIENALDGAGLNTITLSDKEGVEQAIVVTDKEHTCLVFEDLGLPTGLVGVRLRDYTIVPDPADPADYLKFITSEPVPVAEDDSDVTAVKQGILNLLGL